MKQEAKNRFHAREAEEFLKAPQVPLLFPIYGARMMAEGLHGFNEGVNVEGELLKDVRFVWLLKLRMDYRIY